jgi:hypothetical protein
VLVDDINNVWGVKELCLCFFVCDAFSFNLVHLFVENQVDALVAETLNGLCILQPWRVALMGVAMKTQSFVLM